MHSKAFLVTSAFSWFNSFIARSLALRSVTITRPAGWHWMNCDRSKQATASVLGSVDVSKIVIRTLRICIPNSVHQSCIVVIVFNVIYHNSIAIQWLYTTWLACDKQKIKRGLNYNWITDTWKSFSSKFVMLSLQNAGSLCIGDQSRWPRRTSCLYLSNELNFLMLSFSPSSSWLRASKRSYRK